MRLRVCVPGPRNATELPRAVAGWLLLQSTVNTNEDSQPTRTLLHSRRSRTVSIAALCSAVVVVNGPVLTSQATKPFPRKDRPVVCPCSLRTLARRTGSEGNGKKRAKGNGKTDCSAQSTILAQFVPERYQSTRSDIFHHHRSSQDRPGQARPGPIPHP